MPPTFRFAPSPNGYLHLGHAYSAILNYDLAMTHGGRFLLRIEDIDVARSRPDYVEAIFEDLAWLGLTWDEPVVFQSERFPAYEAAAQKLNALGITYRCAATRTQLAAAFDDGAPRDPDGAPRYRPICRADGAENPPACEIGDMPSSVRLSMSRASARLPHRAIVTEWYTDGRQQARHADPTAWGDAIIVRKDTPASYHLAVVVDDAAQGISHVVRGADLAPATDLHALLQCLLGLAPPVYHHHRLILAEDGRKLSKSSRDTALRELRRQGVKAGDIRTRLGLPKP